MKKAINITLAGIVFNIEEDAYKALDDYLESIKKRYKNKKEQEEIMADIEIGIAEKFSRMVKFDKKAVTLKNVKEVIKIMGSAQEITENEKENEEEVIQNDFNFQPAKRMYRNPDDVVIAGVCSGLAAYFGIDPVFVRIIFILLIFANGIGLLAYFILWIVVPKAATSAQKLEMQGRPVNLKKLEEAVKDKSKIIKQEGKNAWKNLSKNKPLFYKIINFPIIIFQQSINFLRRFFQAIWPVSSIILGVIFAVSMVLSVLALTLTAGVLIFNIHSPYVVSDINLAVISSNFSYYAVILSSYIIALVPVIFILLLGLALIKRKNTFTPVLSGILVSIWILAIAVVTISGLQLAPVIHSAVKEAQDVETITQNFDYKDFTKLYLGGNFQAKITKGDDFSIIARGEEGDLARMNFVIEENQLQITRNKKEIDGICVFCFDRPVELEITAPELKSYVGINLSSADIKEFSDDIYLSLGESSKLDFYADKEQNITGSLAGVSSRLEIINSPRTLDIKLIGFSKLVAEDLNTESITINQDVVSRATLGGKTKILQAELEGSAKLYAFDLKSQAVVVKASDQTKAQVKAIESLQAIASDYSDIFYQGVPADLMKKTYQNGVVKPSDDFDIDELGVNAGIFIQNNDEYNRIILRNDIDQYSPIMSSARGIGFTPVYNFFGTEDKNIRFYWSTDFGRLVEDFTGDFDEFNQEIINSGDKVYWTFGSEYNEISDADFIKIHVSAKDEDSGVVLDRRDIELEVIEEGVVRVKK